jgi:hypothetical protein
MVKNLEIGKTYYVAGCSQEYQIENPIVAVHKEQTYYMAEEDSGEKKQIWYDRISPDGIAWYAGTSLSETLGK